MPDPTVLSANTDVNQGPCSAGDDDATAPNGFRKADDKGKKIPTGNFFEVRCDPAGKYLPTICGYLDKMITRVCITVDTEFSIGGAFSDNCQKPVADPMVWCDVGGKSEGLGFLLSTFDRYQVAATFFVESLHKHYFRQDPMSKVVRAIQAAGHEIQLHAHPCWTAFKSPDWQSRVASKRPKDNFFGMDVDATAAAIDDAIDLFNEWDVAAPRVFRSGNLQHDDVLYAALAKVGIPFSSNIGLSIFNSGDPRYQLYSGRHERHGVWEAPVLTFCDFSIAGRAHLKTLTVAGTSFLEMKTLLERAYDADIPLVVILTHPFEYVQFSSSSVNVVRRHSINQQRLSRLCSFLDQNRTRFAPVGLAGAQSDMASKKSTANVLLNGVLWQSMARVATQATYDYYGRVALAASGKAAA